MKDFLILILFTERLLGKNLRCKNLKSIITDGGKSMCDKNKGLVAFVSKAIENDGGSKSLVLYSSKVLMRKLFGFV